MTNVADFLKSRGIQPSIQRVLIAEYLWKHREHPSADDIFANLHNSVPTLSKATVYNTLNLFYNRNIVTIIVTEDGERHYDGFIEPHAHAICPACGRIEDIPLNEKEQEILDKIACRTNSDGITISMKKLCNNCN